MIIKKLKETLLGNSTKVETQTSLLEQKNIHYTNKELKDSAPTYVGAAAPVYLDDDPWFGPAVISDEAKDYLVQKFESDMARTYDENGNTKEPDNIHELMYKMYSDGMTAQQLPWASIEKNTPPLWQSGTGMGQFRNETN